MRTATSLVKVHPLKLFVNRHVCLLLTAIIIPLLALKITKNYSQLNGSKFPGRCSTLFRTDRCLFVVCFIFIYGTTKAARNASGSHSLEPSSSGNTSWMRSDLDHPFSGQLKMIACGLGRSIKAFCFWRGALLRLLLRFDRPFDQVFYGIPRLTHAQWTSRLTQGSKVPSLQVRGCVWSIQSYWTVALEISFPFSKRFTTTKTGSRLSWATPVCGWLWLRTGESLTQCM